MQKTSAPLVEHAKGKAAYELSAVIRCVFVFDNDIERRPNRGGRPEFIADIEDQSDDRQKS